MQDRWTHQVLLASHLEEQTIQVTHKSNVQNLFPTKIIDKGGLQLKQRNGEESLTDMGCHGDHRGRR